MLDEVKGFAVWELVDEVACEVVHGAFEGLDASTGEGGTDCPSQLGVARRVGHDEHGQERIGHAEPGGGREDS